MSELSDRLGRVEERIGAAARAVETDSGASPVLVAVVNEFLKKSDKTRKVVDRGDDGQSREAIVELEQAGDSAKAAAEADNGISEDTRKAVIDAHDRICVMKTKMVSA